jgi:acyl dehydratase
MPHAGGDISLDPLPVRACTVETREFAAALGLATETIPLTFPIRWLALPPIRKAIEDVVGPNPIHLSQSFNFAVPLAADRDYQLKVSIRRNAMPPSRVIVRATLSDQHDRILLQSETALLPTSAITRAPTSPKFEPTRDQLRDIAFGPFDKARVVRYAEAAHDDSRLHRDPEFARSLGFDRPIIHGMLIMGLFQKALGEWQMNGDVARLFALFVRPVPIGERLFVGGRMAVSANAPAGNRGIVRLLARNERDEIACIGEAEFSPARSRPI